MGEKRRPGSNRLTKDENTIENAEKGRFIIMRNIILFILLCILFPYFSFSQENENSAFSPFVSRIHAEAHEMSIVLTWESPEGTAGKVLIYRHTEEITEKNLGLTRLLMVADIATESYVDPVTDTKEYYYAILIQDAIGTIHKIFVPYRNKTVTGVRITDITPEEERATRITGLHAEVSGDSIIITFQTSKPERQLFLYRSTSPLTNKENLLAATTPVLVKEYSTRYVDYPVAGIDYYYAVMDAGLAKTGTISLVPGKNSLKKPVKIPLKDDTAALKPVTKRSLPLPYLDIISDIEFGGTIIPSVSSYLPEKKQIQDKTEEIINHIISRLEQQQEETIMEPDILPVDRAGSTGGESAILQKIVSEYFSKALYYKAETQLRDYLRIKHSEEVEARSHFYLGQILYFKGAYKDALLAFLMSQDYYYVEIQPWLDACFHKIFQQ
jgi:hypothetical protein